MSMEERLPAGPRTVHMKCVKADAAVGPFRPYAELLRDGGSMTNLSGCPIVEWLENGRTYRFTVEDVTDQEGG